MSASARLGAALLALLAASTADATPPASAPAPLARPVVAAQPLTQAGPLPLRLLEDAFAAPPATLAPASRSARIVTRPAATPRARPARPAAPVEAASAIAPRLSPAPERRPRKTAAFFAAAAAPGASFRAAPPSSAPRGQPDALVIPARLRADDAPCGDARLRGALLSRIDGPGACGIDRPIRLEKVAGVRLERPVPVACETAKALADWVEKAARPAVRAHEGVDIASITPFAGYACRPRNNRPGAKLSEHGHGRAIDIGAITLTDGREITVLDGWRNRHAGLMRDLWSTACGPFGTVLGPKADRYHVNHFHFDIARHRSGPVCR